MSDAIEQTAPSAVRSMFGAIGFILLMVGIEGMVPRESIGLAVGTFLVLGGAICFFLAVVWNGLRKYITAEGDRLISSFAKSRAVWGFLAFVFFQAAIFLPFIEQYRWPFIHAPYVIRIPLYADQFEPSLPRDASKETLRVLSTDVDGLLKIVSDEGFALIEGWRTFLMSQNTFRGCNLNSNGLTDLIAKATKAQDSVLAIVKTDQLNALFLVTYFTDEITPRMYHSFGEAAQAMTEFSNELQKAGSQPCDKLGTNNQLLAAYIRLNALFVEYEKWIRLVRSRLLKLQLEIRNAL